MKTPAGTLAFGGSTLNITLYGGVCIQRSLTVLESHFLWTEGSHSADPIAEIHVYPAHTPLPGWPESAIGEEIFVRHSASDFFTIPARRTTGENDEYIRCIHTGTAFAFHSGDRRIEVALPVEGHLDFVELIRDLVLKDQENRGALVLHATAAEKQGALVVISGSKGAGKSTILLELVEHFGFSIVAGDKTLAFVNDRDEVVVTGWPDYPHLGFGTVRKYPGLRAIAGISEDYVPAAEHAFSPRGKFAVDITGFRRRFPGAARGFYAPPTEVLLPAIGPGAATEVREVGGSPADRRSLIGENLESAFDGPHAAWQSFSPDHRGEHGPAHHRILTALGALPTREITGPGDLEGSGYRPVAAIGA